MTTNTSVSGKWYDWQIKKVTTDIDSMSPEELASYILDLQQAVKYSESALRGEYPWYIHGKYTQKEAREAALSTVERVTNTYRDFFVK